jgi:hypothetical protein
LSDIAVIAPGYWPGGDTMREYRGIQLMLNEAHFSYDIIEDSQISNLKEKLSRYRVIILPEITELDPAAIETIKELVENGTSLIATNRSLSLNPEALFELFGVIPENTEYDGAGNYLAPSDYTLFKRLEGQTMLFWKFNLGLYDFSGADETYLPILSKGRPGPPEKIGGHEPTGYHALAIKNHSNARAAILPLNLGKLYYLHGYEQYKHILLDLVDYLYPEAAQQIQTNAHPKVETILQEYRLNTPEHYQQQQPEGIILHLVNLSGFSGNT